MIILFLLFTFLALIWGAGKATVPYHVGERINVSLAFGNLPGYALRTTLRLFIALLFSILFTFVFGTLAARNLIARRVIIPALDILQSVPVLGFLSLTLFFFIAIFPKSLLGPECAVIFVIFTSQAWNMCFSFYQSLRQVPKELREMAQVLSLSSWQSFWKIDVPFALPGLIWNMMLSMSASWFMIVASESISISNQNIFLPGIGSYIGTAVQEHSIKALFEAILVMIVVIFLYDQLLFRPLVAWSGKFRYETTGTEEKNSSLVLDILQRANMMRRFAGLLSRFFSYFLTLPLTCKKSCYRIESRRMNRFRFALAPPVYVLLLIFVLGIFLVIAKQIFQSISLQQLLEVSILGLATALKIVILIFLCLLFWVPIGVWIGSKPKWTKVIQPLIQFLSAFPVNLFYPIAVILIINWHLNPTLWTAPLLVLGTQWYILFNVIAGVSVLPANLIESTKNLGLNGFMTWRYLILPGIFPYIVTGAIAAAGGAWNTSILAEYISWGQTSIKAFGIGSYFTEAAKSGNFPQELLGLIVMSVLVLFFNRLIWQPLYNLAEKRFQFD